MNKVDLTLLRLFHLVTVRQRTRLEAAVQIGERAVAVAVVVAVAVAR